MSLVVPTNYIFFALTWTKLILLLVIALLFLPRKILWEGLLFLFPVFKADVCPFIKSPFLFFFYARTGCPKFDILLNLTKLVLLPESNDGSLCHSASRPTNHHLGAVLFFFVVRLVCWNYLIVKLKQQQNQQDDRHLGRQSFELFESILELTCPLKIRKHLHSLWLESLHQE